MLTKAGGVLYQSGNPIKNLVSPTFLLDTSGIIRAEAPQVTNPDADQVVVEIIETRIMCVHCI